MGEEGQKRSVVRCCWPWTTGRPVGIPTALRSVGDGQLEASLATLGVAVLVAAGSRPRPIVGAEPERHCTNPLQSHMSSINTFAFEPKSKRLQVGRRTPRTPIKPSKPTVLLIK